MLASRVHDYPLHSFDCIILLELHFQVYAFCLSHFFVPEHKEEIVPLNSYLNTEVLRLQTPCLQTPGQKQGFFYVLVDELVALGRTGSSNSVGVVV